MHGLAGRDGGKVSQKMSQKNAKYHSLSLKPEFNSNVNLDMNKFKGNNFKATLSPNNYQTIGAGSRNNHDILEKREKLLEPGSGYDFLRTVNLSPHDKKKNSFTTTGFGKKSSFEDLMERTQVNAGALKFRDSGGLFPKDPRKRGLAMTT